MLPTLDFGLTGRWLLALWVVAVAIFICAPSLDLWVTGLFWEPGVGFPIGRQPLWDWARNAVWDLEIVLFTIALVGWLGALIRHKAVLGLTARAWGYIWTMFLLGPVILVHEVIKVLWGRARPSTIQQFGGTHLFSRAGEISDQCARNCSFVSGEVSSAVGLSISLWLMSCIWHGLEAWQRSYIRAVAIIIPLFITLQRVSAGRHFISDAIFGTLVTLSFAWLLYGLFTGVLPLGRRDRGPGRS